MSPSASETEKRLAQLEASLDSMRRSRLNLATIFGLIMLVQGVGTGYVQLSNSPQDVRIERNAEDIADLQLVVRQLMIAKDPKSWEQALQAAQRNANERRTATDRTVPSREGGI